MGFRQVDPKWDAEPAVAAMKAVHFQVQGFTRSYWDFYTGFGFFVTALQLLAAVLTWQMAGLPADVLARMALVAWGLVVCFAAVRALTWMYFFMAPLIFCGAPWSGFGMTPRFFLTGDKYPRGKHF